MWYMSKHGISKNLKLHCVQMVCF